MDAWVLKEATAEVALVGLGISDMVERKYDNRKYELNELEIFLEESGDKK